METKTLAGKDDMKVLIKLEKWRTVYKLEYGNDNHEVAPPYSRTVPAVTASLPTGEAEPEGPQHIEVETNAIM